MTMIKMDGALIQAYIDLGLGLSTAYENDHFKPPANADWAQISIVPAGSAAFTLGVNGEDLHTGFMQIDFNVKPGSGRAQLMTYAQAIRDEYVIGKGYTLDDQSVRVTGADRSSIRPVDGWTRISMTIYFEATTIRPTI